MKKKALLLFILRILRTGLSVINLTITAKYFGVSIERDEWILASAAILIIDQAIWGPINETFRARFVFLRYELGEAEAMAKARSMFSFINFVTFALVCFCLICPLWIASVIAPKYNQHQQLQLSYMLMLLSPSFLLNQACQFLSALLNAYKKVYLPEIIGFCSVLINIILVVLLSPRFGIYSLVFCYYLSLVLLFVALTVQLAQLKVRVFANPLQLKFANIKPFVIYALPFFIPYFFGQVNSLIEKGISSTMATGAVSVIDYSRKFSEITVNVLSGIFTTMLLPALSAHFVKKEYDAFVREFRSILQLGFLVMMFLTGVFTACPGAVITLLYNRGAISAHALSTISSLSMLYGWSAVAVFLYVIGGTALLSSNKGKYYAMYGAAAQIVMIMFNLMYHKQFGVYTFPLSLAVSHIIIAVLLFKYFPVTGKGLFVIVLKGLMQLVLGCFVLYLINTYIFVNTFPPLVIIAVNVVLIIVFVLMFAYVANTDDKALIKKLISKLRSNFK